MAIDQIWKYIAFTLLNFGYLLEPISKSGKFEPSFHKKFLWMCTNHNHIIIIITIIIQIFKWKYSPIKKH